MPLRSLLGDLALALVLDLQLQLQLPEERPLPVQLQQQGPLEELECEQQVFPAL